MQVDVLLNCSGRFESSVMKAIRLVTKWVKNFVKIPYFYESVDFHINCDHRHKKKFETFDNKKSQIIVLLNFFPVNLKILIRIFFFRHK